MSRTSCSRPPLWRRLGAVAALLALVFASLAVLPHAVATPATEGKQVEAVHVHDHHGDDHDAAHRHGQVGDEIPSSGISDDGKAAPCESGCVTCKDCALCSLATAAVPASLPAGDGFERYAPARFPLPADIDPAGLIEPPRL